MIEGLQDLNFANVDFAISFKQARSCTAAGYDVIEYEISTNPGESRKPLGKIVSGGELSRIMLALKAILADKDQIETFLFLTRSILVSAEGLLRKYPKKWQ